MLVLTFWVDFLVLTTTRCHISTVKIKIIEGIFEQLSKKNHPTSLKNGSNGGRTFRMFNGRTVNKVIIMSTTLYLMF